MNRCLFLLPLLLANTVYAATTLTGRCVDVLDGDTYKAEVVIDGEQKIITVRCSGIDAPEKGQHYADEARELLRQLILNRNITIQYSKIDAYKRYVAKTLVDTPCGTIWAEKALLDAGCAWHFTRYSKSKELQKVEDTARERRVGLWQIPDPQPPWEYRKSRPSY